MDDIYLFLFFREDLKPPLWIPLLLNIVVNENGASEFSVVFEQSKLFYIILILYTEISTNLTNINLDKTSDTKNSISHP